MEYQLGISNGNGQVTTFKLITYRKI